MSVFDIARAFAFAFAVVAAAFAAEQALKTSFGDVSDAGTAWKMLATLCTNRFVLLTAISLVLATVLSRPLARVNGMDEFGSWMLLLFLFVIGLPADLWMVLSQAPLFFVFCAIIAVVNVGFTLVAGKLCRLNLEELLLSMNATLGGAPSAAAMATGAGWTRLVLPACCSASGGTSSARRSASPSWNCSADSAAPAIVRRDGILGFECYSNVIDSSRLCLLLLSRQAFQAELPAVGRDAKFRMRVGAFGHAADGARVKRFVVRGKLALKSMAAPCHAGLVLHRPIHEGPTKQAKGIITASTESPGLRRVEQHHDQQRAAEPSEEFQLHRNDEKQHDLDLRRDHAGGQKEAGVEQGGLHAGAVTGSKRRPH